MMLTLIMMMQVTKMPIPNDDDDDVDDHNCDVADVVEHDGVDEDDDNDDNCFWGGNRSHPNPLNPLVCAITPPTQPCPAPIPQAEVCVVCTEPPFSV